MSKLTILIPTYNRGLKLQRLLHLIDSEIIASGVKERISVLVSDNASPDETQSIGSSFSANNFSYKYFRQPKNLGFDGNVRFLYNQATTEYVWYFADDDIPLPGSIAKVLSALEEHKPDLLLFSFLQPPDSKAKTFDYAKAVELFVAPGTEIELVQRYPKISIYVMRKVEFNPVQLKELEPFLHNGFYFLDLAYSVLGASASPKLAVISEPLASCDSDYKVFVVVPKVFFEKYKVFYHPFVTKYSPGFADGERASSYRTAIQFLFEVKTGNLTGSDMALCDQAIKDMSFKADALLGNHKALLQFVFLKLRAAALYPHIRPLVGFVRSKLN